MPQAPAAAAAARTPTGPSAPAAAAHVADPSAPPAADAWANELAAEALSGAPPSHFFCELRLDTQLGPFQIEFCGADATDGGNVDCVVSFNGPPDAAPGDCRILVSFAAVKRGGGADGGGGAAAASGDEAEAQETVLGERAEAVSGKTLRHSSHCFEGLLRYSELSRAAAAGLSLRATLAAAPGAPLGPDASVRVPADPLTFRAAGGGMLGGRFSDLAVSVGGAGAATAAAEPPRRAHRVVLAAASPVFEKMLDSNMSEGRAAAVELRGSSAAAVDLLLQHIYGGAIQVPLALVLELYSLADQYQIKSDLARQLRLWMGAAAFTPAALAALLPGAHRLLPGACAGSLYAQAAAALGEIAGGGAVGAGALGQWPVDALAEVLSRAPPRAAHAAASAWMRAQRAPAKQRHHWPRLVGAIQWRRATLDDLRAIRGEAGSGKVPGLHEALFDAYEDLVHQKAAEAAAASESLARAHRAVVAITRRARGDASSEEGGGDEDSGSSSESGSDDDSDEDEDDDGSSSGGSGSDEQADEDVPRGPDLREILRWGRGRFLFGREPSDSGGSSGSEDGTSSEDGSR